jgi:hypothetical protein
LCPPPAETETMTTFADMKFLFDFRGTACYICRSIFYKIRF